MGPVEQKPQSLPESSSPSSVPTLIESHHLPATMETHQDFRSLQAKFQAFHPESSELPPKSLKPEFKKLPKKFPQPEPSEHSKKPPQPEFTDLPKKLQQPEFSAVPRKPPQPEFTKLPKKPLQPEFIDLPKKPPQPEFADVPKKPLQPELSAVPRKPLQPEFTELPKKPPHSESSEVPRKSPQPEFTDLPRKPSKPEFSELYKKFPQAEATAFPRKPLQPEVSDALQKVLHLESSALVQRLSQPDLGTPTRPPTEPQISTFPKQFGQPDPNEATQKPSQLEFRTLPKKPPHPEFSVLPQKPQPQLPAWKPESSDPHSNVSQPEFSAFVKVIPQLSNLPKKPLQPEFGDLTRTSSEPEVCVFPKRPQQSEFKAFSKSPQPKLGSLPRTSSEPEVSLYPRKFPQPDSQVTCRKFSQPEPNALSKKPLQAEFLRDPSRKPPLPGSVSESSLPMAVAGSNPRFPLSPGFGARQQRSVPTHSGASRLGLKRSHPPRQRPLPPVSSLGPPPAKPPLPPGLKDVHSFQRPSAAATALRRTRSSAGIHFQARHPKDILQDPEDVYELYDDVQLTDTSPRPSPKGKDVLHTVGGQAQLFPKIQAGHPQEPAFSMEPAQGHISKLEPHQITVPKCYNEFVGNPGCRCEDHCQLDEVPLTQQPPRKPSQDPELRKERAPQPQQLLPVDPKALKQIRKAEKAEREFRKKFKFEGEIVIQTRMMIDPNAKTRRGGGKHLGIRRGEILEVIEFTNKDEMLCRNTKGKYGYVPRIALLPLETEVYDDVGFGDPLESQSFP